jgi:hypothetical protein
MEETIQRLITEGNGYTFSNNSYHTSHGTYTKASVEMQSWIAEVEDFILNNFGQHSSPFRVFQRFSRAKLDGYESDDFEEQKALLMSALKACSRIKPKAKTEDFNKTLLLNNLFNRFHLVARQLRQRHANRPTLDISDEYDVQNLLHSLLRLYFDDIRTEEWTPSYAGGSSRMDFLLKEEQIVIEVKKTRVGINDRELGKQLIEDKAKYKQHPDCKKLICFTYDPEGRINNPKGIQNDLNKQEDEFEVEIVIKP